MSIRLIDAHLHLQDTRIKTHTANLVARAETRGVLRMFCNSTREDDWNEVLALADTYSNVTPFIGLHPWFADRAGPGWQQRLRDRVGGWQGCVGVGEIGLDKYSSVDFNRQITVFEKQLEIGLGLAAPISIHCVRNWDILLDLLGRHLEGRAAPRIMVHSFNGSRQTLQRLIKLGCHVSYSAAILGQNNNKAIDALRATPVDALLLETDAPDQLVPEATRQLELATPYNEPAVVTAVYRAAAYLRGMHLKDLAAQIWKNATIFTHTTAPRRNTL